MRQIFPRIKRGRVARSFQCGIARRGKGIRDVPEILIKQIRVHV